MEIKRFVPNCIKDFLRKNLFPKLELQYVPAEKRAVMLKNFYKAKMGQELDLEHPKLFTEKLQWIKLYYDHPDMRRCIDKIDFKDYVREKIGDGYTARIIKIWNSPEEVSLNSISESKFVVKSTLQSDGIFIAPITDKNEIDIIALEDEIKGKWFDTRLLLTNSFCKGYYGAKPRVFVEEFIEEFAGSANDYKLFCFHGKPAFFYVAEEHFKNGENSTVYPITFYDLNWKVMAVQYGKHSTNPDVDEPWHMKEMIDLAEKLSEPFPFVRVDFFDTKEKLYLAELTFYPGGGITAYHPEEFNLKMGEMLHLPQ